MPHEAFEAVYNLGLARYSEQQAELADKIAAEALLTPVNAKKIFELSQALGTTTARIQAFEAAWQGFILALDQNKIATPFISEATHLFLEGTVSENGASEPEGQVGTILPDSSVIKELKRAARPASSPPVPNIWVTEGCTRADDFNYRSQLNMAFALYQVSEGALAYTEWFPGIISRVFESKIRRIEETGAEVSLAGLESLAEVTRRQVTDKLKKAQTLEPKDTDPEYLSQFKRWMNDQPWYTGVSIAELVAVGMRHKRAVKRLEERISGKPLGEQMKFKGEWAGTIPFNTRELSATEAEFKPYHRFLLADLLLRSAPGLLKAVNINLAPQLLSKIVLIRDGLRSCRQQIHDNPDLIEDFVPLLMAAVKNPYEFLLTNPHKDTGALVEGLPEELPSDSLKKLISAYALH